MNKIKSITFFFLYFQQTEDSEQKIHITKECLNIRFC